MEITIKKLSAGLADDFFGFFDNDAFSDHDEWKWCYCLESHLSAQENDKLWGKKKTSGKGRRADPSGYYDRVSYL